MSNSQIQEQSPIYRLGNIKFWLDNCDDSFAHLVDSLLPHCSNHDREHSVRIDAETITNIRSLQNYIFKLHHNCLWLDAGCLVTPEGKLVLIMGNSGAGKSTTAMALGIAYHWGVIAEDILLIDIEKDELVPLGTPFSLKEGTQELLRQTIGKAPNKLFDNEWAPLGEMGVDKNFHARFDLSILFTPRLSETEALVLTSLDSGYFLRQVMRLCNMVTISGGTDKMHSYISEGKCVSIAGGTLRERLDAIRHLCAVNG